MPKRRENVETDTTPVIQVVGPVQVSELPPHPVSGLPRILVKTTEIFGPITFHLTKTTTVNPKAAAEFDRRLVEAALPRLLGLERPWPNEEDNNRPVKRRRLPD